MGQSSGCAAVCSLSVSPMVKNLFKRVFAISHATFNMPTSYTQDDEGNMIMTSIYHTLSDCEREGDKIIGGNLEALREMSTDDLLKLPIFHPYCIDGRVLTGTFRQGVEAGLSDDYDFIVTYTSNDPMLFMLMKDMAGPEDYERAMRSCFGEIADRAMKLYPLKGNYQEFVASVAKDRYTASAMMFASLRKNSNTWLAEFAQVTPGPESKQWGAFHTSDVPYWLDYFTDKRKDFWREEDYSLGKELVSRLAAFAKTGRPEAENLASWTPSDGSSIFVIDSGSMREVRPLSDEKYQLWRDFYCVN